MYLRPCTLHLYRNEMLLLLKKHQMGFLNVHTPATYACFLECSALCTIFLIISKCSCIPGSQNFILYLLHY